jgi:hypothetical protein
VVLFAMPITAGCSFHRSITNEAVRSLDPTFLVVGATTRGDVLRRLGPPAPSDLIRADVSPDQPRFLRYSCVDTKVVRFEPSYIVSLPFRWSDSDEVYSLLLEFDEGDVLSAAYESARSSVWRPIQEDSGGSPARVHELGRTDR